MPPFVTKRWLQKCPQGTFVGIGRRFSLSGHKRLRCFAHPLRAFEPPSALFPPAVHCGVCGALRATMIAVAVIYYSMAGRRPACLCDVKMSDEEAAAHRAPGTIVRTTATGEGRGRSRTLPSRHSRSGASFCAANSGVFRDRSARCAAASRPFSPRGLLWLFLRKKEQETLRVEVCGAHACVAGLRGRRLRPARRLRAAASCKLKSATVFLRTFGLTQKYQKVKHGEKPRVASPVLAERPRKTALFRTPAPGVRTAVRSVSSCGALRSLRCASRNNDCSCCYLLFYGRPQACLPPRCENVGRRSCRTPSARNDRAISAVFRDRSARGAADSRRFSPRGLLWLFLRKKEQEKLAGRRLRPLSSVVRQPPPPSPRYPDCAAARGCGAKRCCR